MANHGYSTEFKPEIVTPEALPIWFGQAWSARVFTDEHHTNPEAFQAQRLQYIAGVLGTTVFAPDLPGYTPGRAFTEEQVRQLNIGDFSGIADQMVADSLEGVSQPNAMNVVGLSLGASIAPSALRSLNDREVATPNLVLITPGSVLSSYGSLISAMARSGDKREDYIRQNPEGIDAPSNIMTAFGVSKLLARHLIDLARRYPRALARHNLAEDILQKVNPGLTKVTFVVGKKDPVSPPHLSERIADRLINHGFWADIDYVAGGTHMFSESCPLLAGKIKEALDRGPQ